MKQIVFLIVFVISASICIYWFARRNSLCVINYANCQISIANLKTWPHNTSGILKTPVQGSDNIFFIESSCAITGPNKNTITMNPRQACAVESTAYHNPHKHVYYMDTCLDINQFDESVLKQQQVVRQVLNYDNIHVFPVQLISFMKDSPLEDWIKLGLVNHSLYPVGHASDIIRLITLWRYGGVYLDLDMVVLRPLDGLGEDFLVAETDIVIGNSVLSFSLQGKGHSILEVFLKELMATYKGTIWAYNGPLLITRVMTQLCNFIPIPDMTAEKCKGLVVHQPVLFFPLYHTSWELLFEECTTTPVMSLIMKNDTYSVHAWNKHSHAEPIRVGSKQPYALLASSFCPNVISDVYSSF